MGTFGDTLKGGMGGLAATGGNPLGGLVGAGLGMFGGLFGGGDPAGSEQQRLLMALAQEQAGRRAPGMGLSQAGLSGFRDNQRNLISGLEAMAAGRGPSAATAMLQQQAQAGAANQQAMAAGARGNPALAARNAMNNTAALQGQAAGQAAVARAQEQLGAYSQLGGAIGTGRQQDEQLGMFNAGQANDMERARALAQLQFWAQNDMGRLNALNSAFGNAGAMAQQPSIGDYLMAFGGSLGQMRGMAKQSQQDQGAWNQSNNWLTGTTTMTPNG